MNELKVDKAPWGPETKYETYADYWESEVLSPLRNAEIRAKRSEGKLHMDQRDGGSIIFRCPCCQVENWVDLRKFK